MEIYHHSTRFKTLVMICKVASTFDLAAFSGFYDRPSKDICQSFENHREHAQNANNTSEQQCFADISVQDFFRFDNVFLFAI